VFPYLILGRFVGWARVASSPYFVGFSKTQYNQGFRFSVADFVYFLRHAHLPFLFLTPRPLHQDFAELVFPYLILGRFVGWARAGPLSPVGK